MVAERPIEALSLITDAAEAGDERVLATLTDAGEALGTVLDDVLGSLNPHAAILGGYLGRICASSDDRGREQAGQPDRQPGRTPAPGSSPSRTPRPEWSVAPSWPPATPCWPSRCG